MTDKPATLGQGFQKRQLVDTPQIAVNPDDIAAMQRGYEIRLARQRDALTRMGERLEMLTGQVAEEMRKANEAAAKVREDDQGPLFSYKITDGDVEELLKLIPPDWDLYNEDDTPRTIIAGYVKHCRTEAEHQKSKQSALVKYYDEWTDILRYTSPLADRLGVNAESLLDTVKGIIAALDNALAQATTDARHNAKQANAVMKATQPNVGDIGDDTPPWEEGKPQAFVAPVELDRSAGVPQPLEVGEDRETLTWDGASSLMPGEQRPGNSF